MSDVDTVWMRNPLPFMAALPQADVLTSSDHLVQMGAGGFSTEVAALVQQRCIVNATQSVVSAN